MHSRRGLLAAVGGAVWLAGCAATDPPEDDDEEGLQSGAPGGGFLEHPVGDLDDLPEGYRCDGICGMVVREWRDWHARVGHASGEALLFCSPGDMIIYAQDPVGHSGIDSDIETVEVSEFGSGELIDGHAAHYVLDYDEERFQEPMENNPRPFATLEDAHAFVAEHDDLDETDVVGFADFDRELAEPYSTHRIPPWQD